MRSLPLVPMPGQRARRSVAGVGTLGKTSVVLAERIHEAVGPREKYGPKPIVLSSAAHTQPKAARKARAAVDFMMNKSASGSNCACAPTGDSGSEFTREWLCGDDSKVDAVANAYFDSLGLLYTVTG